MELQNVSQIFINPERTISGTGNSVEINDYIVNCDTSGGLVDLTLVEIPTGFDREYKLYVIDSGNNASLNNITINAPVGHLINGKSSYTISGDGESALLRFVKVGEYIAYSEPYRVNNTVYLDAIHGDDAFGQRERPLKAFSTPAAALAASVAGDTIVVRPGDFDDEWLLKDGVNIHFEMGVNLTNASTSNRIMKFDNSGATCKTNITGFPNIVYDGTSQVFRFNGIDLDITINILNSRQSRQFINWVPRSANSKLKINIIEDAVQDPTLIYYSPDRWMNIAGTNVDYEERIKITWGGRIEAAGLYSFGAGINVDVESHGDFYAVQDAGFLSVVNMAGTKHTHYGNVYSLHPYADPYGLDVSSGLINQAQGDVEVHGDVYSISQPCFRPVFLSGITKIYNSTMFAENVIPIFNKPTANGGGNTYFYGCNIQDGVGNTSPQVIRMEDDPTSATDINNLWFYNCRIEKEQSFVGVGGVIYKDQDDTLSKLFMFGSIVICAANQDLTETDLIANGNFFFSETFTNKALGANTANVGGTLYENNTYIE